MKNYHKYNQKDAIAHTNIVSFQGDISRRVGNIRSVVLRTKTKAVDEYFGSERVMQDSIGDLFETKPRYEIHNDNYLYNYLRRS